MLFRSSAAALTRILRESVEVARHDDVLHHVPELQERLEVHVIVVAVRDEHVVDRLGQILVGEARRLRAVRVADDRVGQNRHVARLDQQRRVAEVADAEAVAVPVPVRRQDVVVPDRKSVV